MDEDSPLLENLEMLKKTCSFHAWKTELMNIMEKRNEWT